MKKIINPILALVLALSVCSVAQATDFETRGSAVALGVTARYVTSTHLYTTSITLTNISGSDVNARVVVYDQDGSDVSSYATVFSGNASGNNLVTIATGSTPFEMPAGSTRYISVVIRNTSKYIKGHAIIEWSTSDPHLKKALMGFSEWILTNGNRYGKSAIPINSGRPF